MKIDDNIDWAIFGILHAANIQGPRVRRVFKERLGMTDIAYSLDGRSVSLRYASPYQIFLRGSDWACLAAVRSSEEGARIQRCRGDLEAADRDLTLLRILLPDLRKR